MVPFVLANWKRLLPFVLVTTLSAVIVFQGFRIDKLKSDLKAAWSETQMVIAQIKSASDRATLRQIEIRNKERDYYVQKSIDADKRLADAVRLRNQALQTNIRDGRTIAISKAEIAELRQAGKSATDTAVYEDPRGGIIISLEDGERAAAWVALGQECVNHVVNISEPEK